MRILTATMKKELTTIFNGDNWTVEDIDRYDNENIFDAFINREISDRCGFDILSLVRKTNSFAHANGVVLDAFLVSSFQSKKAKIGSKICYTAQVVFYFEDGGI